MLKKLLVVSLTGAVCLLVGALLANGLFPREVVREVPKEAPVGELASLTLQTTADLDADTRVYDSSNTVGTSTFNGLTYFTAGTSATTSLIFSTERAVSVDLNIWFDASSTASRLHWNYEFSNNKMDWFGEDTKTVTTNTSTYHGNATTTHTWVPNVESGPVAKNVGITPMASKYMRINFNVSGANGALWAQAVLKETYN